MSAGDLSEQTLRIIVGPTAAGKSAIAMYLAQQYGLAIISADSRQIYRGFDIGTAKPTREERARVRHFGVDVLDPTSRYSAHQWAQDAEQWRRTAHASGQGTVIVGGTGFYIRALVHPLDDMPELDADRRAALAEWLETLSREELQRWCYRLDPPRSRLGRTQQLRAVETALLAGQALSVSARDLIPPDDTDAAAAGHRAVRYLVVDPGPSLATRIADRVHAMVDAGWADEVRYLHAHLAPDAPAWKASGYRTLRDAVVSDGNWESAIERVIIETRQYAKRQRTWFRHQLPSAHVTKIDSVAPDALDRAHAWWESADGSVA